MIDENKYDFVIIGTGLTETAIGCLLAKTQRYRVLQIDTSSSYGSEFSTLRYTQLQKHFGVPESLDVSTDELTKLDTEFNIDLTPKLLLQESALKDFLLKHEIHNLVTFNSIPGSYFFYKKFHSVPVNEVQSLKSSVISWLQKHRVVKFFYHVRNYAKDPTIRVSKTMREEFAQFGLSQDSIDFIGHAVALNLNDNYLDENPIITYNKIVHYVSSIVYYENSESPFIYPMYGLSELCQSFARISATYGGVFMLNAVIENVDQNTLRIIDSNGEHRVIEFGKIVADPHYFVSSRLSKRIIRCILICRRREDQFSRNIIFFKKEFRRENDIFCVVLGEEDSVCPAGYEVAIISTLQETPEDNPENEIKMVFDKFDIIKKYVEVRKVFENDDTDNIIFTKGIDESAIMDNIYADIERIKGILKLE